MLKLMREELEVCMALAGCPTLDDIGGDALMPAAPPRHEKSAMLTVIEKCSTATKCANHAHLESAQWQDGALPQARSREVKHNL